MTPKSLAEVAQSALGLNSADKPYVIESSSNQIVGKWNILDAKWLEVMSANKADQTYSITFILDESTHQYEYSEQSNNSSSSFAAPSSGGGLSFSTGGSSFKGKQLSSKDIGAVFGFGMKKKDQPAQAVGVATYNFDNNAIKQPLIDILAACGWTEKKKGIFKSLF